MGYRPEGGVGGVVAAVVLVVVFATSLAWVWATLGLILRSPTAVSTLSFVVQFPLLFASNVFVSPSTMPGWLRAFVEVNPVSLLATTVRDLMAGSASAAQVIWVLVAAAGVTAIFAPLTMRLYRTG
jgi:daunorubicin/doxorubicin transport system permease protein